MRPVQALPEPGTLGQINEFIARADSLFKEGTQFLKTLAEISNNPALKKIASQKLGLKQGATAATLVAESEAAQPTVEGQFEQIIAALNQFKVLVGDVSISQLVEWLQKNKETVISGMKAKLK